MGPTRFDQSSEMPEKQGVTEKRGTESGTVGGDSGFAEDVASIMQLPLSDDGPSSQGIACLAYRDASV